LLRYRILRLKAALKDGAILQRVQSRQVNGVNRAPHPTGLLRLRTIVRDLVLDHSFGLGDMFS
jgi:hypothetical protein